jgi:hypothetical protein
MARGRSEGLFQVIQWSFSGPQNRLMGSEGSVLPSDGIPLVDAHGVLGMAWGCLGHYCFLPQGDC